jgi:hypothetical protein
VCALYHVVVRSFHHTLAGAEDSCAVRDCHTPHTRARVSVSCRMIRVDVT